MPIVYENEGHRRRLIKMYPYFQWKILEWRKDPHCRRCGVEMHIDARQGSWKRQATLDHKIARCLGGEDVPDNWELICGKCNNDKSKIENKELSERRKIDLDISK